MRPFIRGWSWRGVAASGAVLCLLPTAARSAADPRYVVDTVLVDSPRTRLPSPQFTTILPGRLPAEAYADLSERLAHAVGVSVRSFGAPGALSAVSIRGSSSAQVDVYYDGIPLARARDGLARLGALPLANVSSVEVTRGWAPIALGSAPIGGSINLVPLALPARAMTARLAGGSFGTWDASIARGFAARDGGRSLTLYADAFRTSGNYRYVDDNGTPFTLADDELVQRINHHATAASGGAAFRATLGGRWTLSALLDAGRRDAGIPGTGAVQAEHARLVQDRALVDVRVRRAAGDHALVEASIYDVAARERFTDREGELGGGNQDDDDRSSDAGARVRALVRVGDDEAECALERSDERWRAIDLWPAETRQPLLARTTDRLAAEYRVRLLGSRVTVAPSYRLEHARSQASGPVRIGGNLPVQPTGLAADARLESPAIGVSCAPVAALELKGHTGRYHRLPSVLELFGERGTVTGNPRLGPESGTHSDVGAQLRIGRAHAEVAFFRLRTRDLIVFVQNSQRTSVPLNVSAADIDGCEVGVAATFGSHVLLDANGTLETARDASASIYTRGRLLPGRPLREGYAALTVRARRWDVRTELAASASSYLDRANRVAVPSRVIPSVGVTARVTPATALTLTAKNLTDTHVVDVAGYPLPGRAVYVSLERTTVHGGSTP